MVIVASAVPVRHWRISTASSPGPSAIGVARAAHRSGSRRILPARRAPVVQVYAARAVRWRGYFGVHTWVAVKPRDAAEYTVYEVNGWRLRRTGSAVSIDHRPPDSRWFGNRPELLADRRGEGVDELITRIEAAVAAYPYADTYRVWPGPNSNTFVAHVLRAAPELRADLPATAIGKDYLGLDFVAWSPSGTGAQVNLFGAVRRAGRRRGGRRAQRARAHVRRRSARSVVEAAARGPARLAACRFGRGCRRDLTRAKEPSAGSADTAAVKQQLEVSDTVVLGSGYNDARALMAALVENLERSLQGGQLELPSLPEVALKIRRALADDDVSVSEIARLLGTDPALAARTLRVANSAMFYRGSRPITSLNGAVSQLGYKMVRNVTLSFAAQQVFIGYGNRALRDLVSAVWRHSVHAAVVSHMLARVRTKLNADEAFLAGLLHEVGKLYILMQAKDTVEVLANDPSFQSVLAAWHPRVGRAVIEAWELSPELAVAVGDHETLQLGGPRSAVDDGRRRRRQLPRRAQRGCVCRSPSSMRKRPSFGSLSLDKPTFDWLIRAADVDVRLLTISFGV